MMSYSFCVPSLPRCLACSRCSIDIWYAHKEVRKMLCLIPGSWKWFIFGKVSLNFSKDSLIQHGYFHISYLLPPHAFLHQFIHPSIPPFLYPFLHLSIHSSFPCPPIQHLLRFYDVPMLVIMVTEVDKTGSQSFVGAEDKVKSDDNTVWEMLWGEFAVSHHNAALSHHIFFFTSLKLLKLCPTSRDFVKFYIL